MTPLGGHATESNVRQRLEQDLSIAFSRLRRLGGVVEFEAQPGIGDNAPFADAVDDIQASASREISLATRELVVKHVQRLSTALRRLHDGEYGVCADCAESISPARLHALPEVHTCVRCQDALERLGRRSAGRQRSTFAIGEDPLAGPASHASLRSSYLPNEEDRDGREEPRVLDVPGYSFVTASGLLGGLGI
jgi:RNA polymerase-binding transcription factor DksA